MILTYMWNMLKTYPNLVPMMSLYDACLTQVSISNLYLFICHHIIYLPDSKIQNLKQWLAMAFIFASVVYVLTYSQTVAGLHGVGGKYISSNKARYWNPTPKFTDLPGPNLTRI